MKKTLFLIVMLIFCALMLSSSISPVWGVSAVPGLQQFGEGRQLFPVESINRLSIAGDVAVIEDKQPVLQLQTGTVWYREPLGVADGFASAFRFRSFTKAHENLHERVAGRLRFAILGNEEIPGASGKCREGLPNSILIELNLGDGLSPCGGGDWQEGGINIRLNERLSLGQVGAAEVPPPDDGQTHLLMVEYEAGVLNIYLDNLNNPIMSAGVDVAAAIQLHEGRAWLGFLAEGAAAGIEITEWWHWPAPYSFSVRRSAIASVSRLEDGADKIAPLGEIITAAVPSGYCPGPASSPDNGTYQVLNPGSSSTIITSTHFAARWNATNGVPLTQAQTQTGLSLLEQLWTKYITELAFSKPYANDAAKFKVDVNVSNQGWATGGGTGTNHPGMWLHYNAFQDPGALAHELTHSIQFATRGLRDSEYTGWFWECHAEWMRHQFFRDQVNCAEMLVNYPHLYYGSTRNRYCNWQFWEFIKDKYCIRTVNDIWALSKKPGEAGYRDEDPFTVLARNVGWSQSQLNDEFGEWAMRNATWDYSNGNVYRQRFGPYSDRTGARRTRVTILQDLDLAQRRFVVPEFWAPQRWGYNLVRLTPDNPGQNGSVTVSFRGVVQTAPASTNFGSFARQPASIPPPGSDWRWGLVARSSSGAARYSPMQSGANGQITFQVNSGDTELWLVVVATPSTMHKILWDQMYYTIYRYPWMVQLQGAWPEGYPSPAAPTGAGAIHPNGGGWVASTAQVSATAFVGPRARVIGNAVVSGNARIEDWAIVGGAAQVRDSAIVEDFAQVLNGQVYENARVSALTLVNHGSARIHGSARVAAIMNAIGAFDISGSAQLIGDIELLTSLSRGVFYGIVDAAIAADPAYGANRTAPSPQVTVAGPFTWGGGTTPGTIPLGRRSFQAGDLTTNYIHARSGSAFVDPISSSSTNADKQAATFDVVAGLDTSRPGCVSFRSITNSSQYLRHSGFRILLNTNNNTALFRADATFCPRVGLTGSGVSLESINFPGRFLRR
ncbi:MAG TPA: DUF6055 domain-containing protein, partial [Blastocatellia bacterium]|nr:DUF6055 domain-containing protein [Blastocatellia bacterium]